MTDPIASLRDLTARILSANESSYESDYVLPDLLPTLPAAIDAALAHQRAVVLAEVTEHLRIAGWMFASAMRPGEPSILDGVLGAMAVALAGHSEQVSTGLLGRLASGGIMAPGGEEASFEEAAPLVRAAIEAGLQGKVWP